MGTHICITKCQHDGRIWVRGEDYTPLPGKVAPRHFELKDKKEAVKAKKEQEVTKEQVKAAAERAVQGVGHQKGKALEVGNIIVPPIVDGLTNAEKLIDSTDITPAKVGTVDELLS